MPTYRGQCLCGAARYAIEATGPAEMYLCHCSRCRKESGSGYASTVFLVEARLRFERGSSNLSCFRLEGTRKERVFCTTCGSPLPRETGQGGVALPAGSLDDGSLVRPTAHIFCASAASWEAEARAAARFDALPE